MRNHVLTRRTFLTRAAFAGAGLATSSRAAESQTAVSNSSGTASPTLVAPRAACDCHVHVYDAARFPMVPSPRVPPDHADVSQYRRLQQRLRTSRVVIVTPRNYATQNAVTLDAIRTIGLEHARGVAVLHPSVTDAELHRLHDAGIRGIRFSLNDPATAVVTFDMIEPLSRRVSALGWHVQMHVEGDQVVASADLFRRLPSRLVFDHLGRPPLPAGIDHPSHRILRELIDRGRTWVKLSGAYLNTAVGPPYPEATSIAREFVRAAPERLVWASDWPHPTEAGDRKPDDAVLFDLLAVWAPDQRTRRRILIENPEMLYDFVPSP